MISRRFRIMPVILIMILVAGLHDAVKAQDEATELVRDLEEKYDGIENLSVDFTQKTVFVVTKAVQTTTGSLILKPENRYRITFEDRVIVSDGETVWSWSKPNNQVIIDRFREDPNSLTPERVLLNVPHDYAATMLGDEKIGKTETTVLKMIPNSKKAPVRWFKLWIDEEELVIRRVQVFDLSENETTYDLTRLRIDGELPDSVFQFSIPSGTEILDLR